PGMPPQCSFQRACARFPQPAIVIGSACRDHTAVGRERNRHQVALVVGLPTLDLMKCVRLPNPYKSVASGAAYESPIGRIGKSHNGACDLDVANRGGARYV